MRTYKKLSFTWLVVIILLIQGGICASEWWRSAVIYQIYPRSFQDSNGDGVGDLRGIASRLDYLKELGVTCIWLNPINPSPMKDFGYDVANYVDIEPLFGNLEDFDHLLAEAHKRGIKLIMDWVPNHTSDLHPWFLADVKRQNGGDDWYVWNDKVPNNWLSVFGGSAWTFHPERNQYYFHQFLKAQPDLNWRNPAVVEAMKNTLRFWLDRGIDGFRVDAILHMLEDPLLRDEPVNPAWKKGTDPYEQLIHNRTKDMEGTHELLKSLRAVLEEYDGDRVFIGEAYLPLADLPRYFNDFSFPFNFALVSFKTEDWNSPQTILDTLARYQTAFEMYGGWPNWVLGNHDNPRISHKVGVNRAKAINTLLLTLPGALTYYYGDELLMTNGNIPFDKIKDPFALQNPDIADLVGRDPERTPMQWDCSGPNAGFCKNDVEPWLPIPENACEFSVESERKNADSMLALVQKLIALRKETTAMVYGDFVPLYVDESSLVYARCDKQDTFLVAVNLAQNDTQCLKRWFEQAKNKLLGKEQKAGTKILKMKSLLKALSERDMCQASTDGLSYHVISANTKDDLIGKVLTERSSLKLSPGASVILRRDQGQIMLEM